MSIQTSETAKLGRKIAQDYLTANDLKEAPYDEVVGEVRRKIGSTVRLNNLKRDLVRKGVSPFKLIKRDGEMYLAYNEPYKLLRETKKIENSEDILRQVKMSDDYQREVSEVCDYLNTIMEGTKNTALAGSKVAMFLAAQKGYHYRAVLDAISDYFGKDDKVMNSVTTYFSLEKRKNRIYDANYLVDCGTNFLTKSINYVLKFKEDTESKEYISQHIMFQINRLDLTTESHDLVYGILGDYIEEENPKLMEDVLNQSELLDEITLMVKMGCKDKDYRRSLDREYRLTKNPVVKVLIEYGEELVKLDEEFKQSMLGDYQRELQEIQRQRNKLDALEQELNGRFSHVIGE